MISVIEAKQKVIENTPALAIEMRRTPDALGFVLSQDIAAPFSLPSFRQSSMDGYAVNHLDVASRGVLLPVTGVAKAGEQTPQVLARGTAMRIFTGAPVPEGADAVIMQENTLRDDQNVTINEYPVVRNKNIRHVGQQILAGNTAIEAGEIITPGGVGFLLGMNITEVRVFRKPSVGLLVTGDELIKPGEELRFGQVYESNSSMLVAALKKEGIENVELLYASDDLPSTIEALKNLSDRNDIVLTSGGISVGDYDFVGKAVESLGAEIIFYKIKQKPGKPLLFARKDKKLFFALPGNPASSLVCYYEYVLPCIKKMSGHSNCFLRSIRLPSKFAYRFNGERDEFLKAVATNDEVAPLDGQESFALRSFALANSLIYLPVSQPVVAVGDLVEVHLLPL